MGKTFSAGVRGWADKTKAQMREILQDSVFDILELAQTSQASVKLTGGTFEIGKIPVDSSFLIRSLASGLNGSETGKGPLSYQLVVAQMKAGDIGVFSWTAPYARPIEYGWTTDAGKDVPGRHFVGHNAAKWPETVAANTRRIAGK